MGLDMFVLMLEWDSLRVECVLVNPGVLVD